MADLCTICEKERVVTTGSYDYTRDAGIDPDVYGIVLDGIEVVRCGCGEAPRIPNLEGLHYMIGIALVCHEAPLTGSAIRFLRKTMSCTQEEFALAAQINPITLSDWERDKRIPKKRTRVFAALQFVDAFMQREDAIRALGHSGLSEMFHAFVERNRELAQLPRQTSKLVVDYACTPPAWQIAEFQDARGGLSGCF